MANDTILIVTAARPYPGESISGDAWCVTWYEGRCRIALIDGLGHGSAAADAAQASVAVLERWPELNPQDALVACHAALGGTRGAAISIVQIDCAAGRLTYAGIGNIEARLGAGGHEQRLIAYRGIVGATMRQVRVFDHDVGGVWWLLLHTDGVSSRLGLPDVQALPQPAQQALADHLLERWGRMTDDATLLLITPGNAPS